MSRKGLARSSKIDRRGHRHHGKELDHKQDEERRSRKKRLCMDKSTHQSSPPDVRIQIINPYTYPYKIQFSIPHSVDTIQ